MGNFLFSSSIGRKLVMSITGAFLVLFLTFHMAMNIVLLLSPSAYNSICAFLGANWYALVGTAIIVLGLFVHVLYAIILTLQNRKARGSIRYAVSAKEQGVAWSSKNMFILGSIVAVGLILHLYNFWFNMQLVELLGMHENQFGLHPTDGASLAYALFSQPLYVAIYLIWFITIWLHLTHGMWSMMQSTGFANKIWYPRLKMIGNIWATVLMGGFALVALWLYAESLCLTCM